MSNFLHKFVSLLLVIGVLVLLLFDLLRLRSLVILLLNVSGQELTHLNGVEERVGSNSVVIEGVVKLFVVVEFVLSESGFSLLLSGDFSLFSFLLTLLSLKLSLLSLLSLLLDSLLASLSFLSNLLSSVLVFLELAFHFFDPFDIVHEILLLGEVNHLAVVLVLELQFLLLKGIDGFTLLLSLLVDSIECLVKGF